MKRIQEYVLRLQVWRDTGGQDLVEYALTAGLVRKEESQRRSERNLPEAGRLGIHRREHRVS